METSKQQRLSIEQQRAVSSEHIRRAVSRLVSGEDASNFSASTDYDVLLEDGTRLAPKKVFGLALEDALGIEAFPFHFSAGWSHPCFKLIDAAGYSIVSKSAEQPNYDDEKPSSQKGNKNWTDEELEACLIAYLDMLGKQSAGLEFSKADYRRSLHDGPLKNRSSLDYRFQNISMFFASKSLPTVEGYLPAKNVGRGVLKRLEQIYLALGQPDISDFAPTDEPSELIRRAARLPKKSNTFKPVGAKSPKKSSVTTMQYLRDPSVVQYVLDAAGGRCEHCESEAPFLRTDGTPYLEVHHVRFLADGGPDTICNAVALCPNCHRACHSSKNAIGLKSTIVEKLERLIDY